MFPSSSPLPDHILAPKPLCISFFLQNFYKISTDTSRQNNHALHNRSGRLSLQDFGQVQDLWTTLDRTYDGLRDMYRTGARQRWHTHTHAHHTHTHAHTHTRTHTYTHAHTYTHRRAHTHIHANTRTGTHTILAV